MKRKNLLGVLHLTALCLLAVAPATSLLSATHSAESPVFALDLRTVNPPPTTGTYTVSTFAGTAGSSGSTDAAGSAARFASPRGVAVDAAGNVYVADSGNETIRKITPSGVVTTLAGSPGVRGTTDGTGSAARFNIPSDVAVDATGNVYVADSNNETIRKITPSGAVTTIAGLPGVVARRSVDGTGSAARFANPSSVAVDALGNVYVSDDMSIRKITPSGVVTTLAGLAGANGSTDGVGSNARFLFPSGLAVDGTGNLFVADSGNFTIRKVTPSGVVTTVAGTAGARGSADGTGSDARFYNPIDVSVDTVGNLYVVEYSNQTIRKITTSGVVTTLAGAVGVTGSVDGTGSTARFNNPWGIAIDAAANFFVADSYNSTVRKGVPSNEIVSPKATLVLTPTNVKAGEEVTLSVSFTPASGEKVTKVEYYLLTEQIRCTTSGGPTYPVSLRVHVPVFHVLKAKVYVAGRTAPYESEWKKDFRPRPAAADLDPASIFGEPSTPAATDAENRVKLVLGGASAVVALGEHNTIGNRGKPARRNIVGGNPTGGFLLQVPRVRVSDQDEGSEGEVPALAHFDYASTPRWAIVADGPMVSLPTPLLLPRATIMSGAALNLETNPSNDVNRATRDPNMYGVSPLLGKYVIATPSSLGDLASEFQANTNLAVYRITNFQGKLLDGGQTTGEVTASQLKDRMIIMVHGWQPSGAFNPYTVDQFGMLAERLRREVTDTNWSLVGYNWSADATAGSNPMGGIAVSLNRNESRDDGADSISLASKGAATPGIKAAEIAYQHGLTLGKRLMDAKGGNLKVVHLIAHSAGSWAAYGTTRYLRARGYSGEIQVTLLDPFMPAETDSSTLSDETRMRSLLGKPQMASLPVNFPGTKGEFLNLYAPDASGAGTGQVFQGTWRERKLEVSSNAFWPIAAVDNAMWWLNAHGYPIEWYADSVDSFTWGISRLGFTSAYSSYGFSQSPLGKILPHVESLYLTATRGENSKTQLKASQGASDFSIVSGPIETPSWVRISALGELSFQPPATTTPGLHFFRVRFGNAVKYRTLDLSVDVRASSLAPSTLVDLPMAGTVVRPLSVGSGLRLNSNLTALAGGNPNNVSWYLERTPGRSGQSSLVINGRQVAALSDRVLVGKGPVLELANITSEMAGTYYAEVVLDNVSYRSGQLVLELAGSRLVNLSTRGTVRPGEALTPGFVMSGTGNKRLVIRAIGPALTQFGVGGALSDTRLEVIRSGASTALMSNDNWGGTTALTGAFAAVGAFPLTPTSLDSAVQADFAVGGYSVRLSPSGAATTGIALAEVYDADPDGPVRLVNVSTLGFVGTGAEALSPGFVIRGTAPMSLLIRAVGPGLNQFGVGGVLADPQFAVIPAGQAAAIASNDNWGGTAALKAAFTAAGAFVLTDSSRDAAAVVSLPPGGYTVVVSGVGNTTGTALVEVYELPP